MKPIPRGYVMTSSAFCITPSVVESYQPVDCCPRVGDVMYGRMSERSHSEVLESLDGPFGVLAVNEQPVVEVLRRRQHSYSRLSSVAIASCSPTERVCQYLGRRSLSSSLPWTFTVGRSSVFFAAMVLRFAGEDERPGLDKVTTAARQAVDFVPRSNLRW